MKIKKIYLKKKNKKGFEMAFSWIFAIIAGSVILFLALYGTNRIIDVAKYTESTENAKAIDIILDPLETGIASAIGDVISFRAETRTYYECYPPTERYRFGRHTIAFSEKSGIKEEWAIPGGEITVQNKFIFSNKLEQGEKLYVFSKPFYTGFKVTDLTMLTSDKYCFVATPNILKEELEQLNLANINLTDGLDDCPDRSISVCFGGFEECDSYVYSDDEYKTGYVVKEGVIMNYFGSLIYAAIFAEPDVYECNIKRIGSKISALSGVYYDKAQIVKIKDCQTLIEPQLDSLASFAENLESSADLFKVYDIIEVMEDKNKRADCKIYSGESY